MSHAGGSRAAGDPTGTGKIVLKDSPYQKAFLHALSDRLSNGHRAFTRVSLFSGRRGGKTLVGSLGVAEQAKAPDQMIWACAPSYPKLYDYVIPAIARVLPPKWLAKPFSAQHYEWRLVNGTTIQARSLDDVNRGRGPGLDLLWIDEARECAQTAWKTLVPALVDRRGAAIITTTPNGFDWCYDAFWLPAQEEAPGYWACKYRSLDNPGLPAEEVEAARRDMDPLFFQQEFEAEFVSFTGAIYGDVLNPQILDTPGELRNLIPEWPKVNPERPVIVGIDIGADHPTAAVPLVLTEFGLVALAEYCARDSATLVHARNIFAMLHQAQLPTPTTWAIDRSAKQSAIEFSQHGIYCAGAENEVVAGIQRVKSWLFARKLWLYRPGCPKLVQQLFSYRWAENVDTSGQARRERVIKTNDDLCDALRYGVMTWPELDVPAEPLPLRKLDALPDAVRWSLERQQRIESPELFEDEALDAAGMLAEDKDSPLGNFWG